MASLQNGIVDGQTKEGAELVDEVIELSHIVCSPHVYTVEELEGKGMLSKGKGKEQQQGKRGKRGGMNSQHMIENSTKLLDE